MDCRPGCGACCIAPSISSPLPGLAQGKPAGVVCPHLDSELRCRLFGRPERPAVCASLRPEPAMCGERREHALAFLAELERATAPAAGRRTDVGGRDPCRDSPAGGFRRRCTARST